MGEKCQIFLIGDSLFTEMLAQMLAEAESVTVVGTAVAPITAVTAVTNTHPHIIIIANAGEPSQTNLNPLLSQFPDTPIINADLNQNYVQIITSRRVSARRTDLLAAIEELSTQRRWHG